MQFEELLELVREVGKAGLTDFEYNEGDLSIKMSAAEKGTADKDGSNEFSQGGQDSYAVETNIPIRHDKEIKKEVIEAPVEGVFYFTKLDGTKCPLKQGDFISTGQVLGMMESRGKKFELFSQYQGRILNIYIEDGEELVAREAMFMVAV